MKRFHNPWMFLLTFYLGQLDENLLSSEPQWQDSRPKSDADVCIVGQDREDRHQVIGRAWASINKGKLLCPIHIWPAMGLRSPYPAPIPLSGRPFKSVVETGGIGCSYAPFRFGLFCPYPPFRAASVRSGGWRRLWDFRTDDRRHVVGGIAQSLHGHCTEAAHSKTKMHAARSPHGHRTISAQPLHGSRTGSVWFSCRGCGVCTATALRLHDFRTIFVQPLYGFTQACPRGPIQEIARCS